MFLCSLSLTLLCCFAALQSLDVAQLHASFKKIETVYASLLQDEQVELARATQLQLMNRDVSAPPVDASSSVKGESSS
jgi:hypothetical protein